MSAIVWLAVYEHEMRGGSRGKMSLYFRTWPRTVGNNLRAEDSIDITPGEPGDGGRGVTTEVKTTVLRFDGDLEVNLYPYILDPTPRQGPAVDPRYERAWWTETNGSLHDLLVGAGWIVYNGEG